MVVRRWLAMVVAIALAGRASPPAAQASGIPPLPPKNLAVSYDAGADACITSKDY